MPLSATSTRYSLVKGERIVRSVFTAWLREFPSLICSIYTCPRVRGAVYYPCGIDAAELYCYAAMFAMMLVMVNNRDRDGRICIMGNKWPRDKETKHQNWWLCWLRQMNAYRKSLDQVNQLQEDTVGSFQKKPETGRVKCSVHSIIVTAAYKGALVPVNSSFSVKFSSRDCRCGAITRLHGQPTTITRGPNLAPHSTPSSGNLDRMMKEASLDQVNQPREDTVRSIQISQLKSYKKNTERSPEEGTETGRVKWSVHSIHHSLSSSLPGTAERMVNRHFYFCSGRSSIFILGGKCSLAWKPQQVAEDGENRSVAQSQLHNMKAFGTSTKISLNES
ncbi:hypothetical protein V6N13_135102 [Hibiscus sabdariffa]